MGLWLRSVFYRLPLRAPLNLGASVISDREGLLVCLEYQDGRPSWGECAPLPGFSHESLSEAAHQLRDLQTILHSKHDLTFLQGQALLPSVAFGLESADPPWAHSYPQVNNQSESLPDHLTPALGPTLSIVTDREGEFSHFSPALSVNALITASEPIKTAVTRLTDQGYTSVKLKVGKHPIEQDIQRVLELYGLTQGKIAIRLDANRAWDLETAVDFGRGIRDIPIDYIEEPLTNPAELTKFYQKTGLPIALDETLREWTQEAFLGVKGVSAWIIKPTLHGRLSLCTTIAALAKTHGIRTVWSSSFETPMGLAAIASAASMSEPTPAGLDTIQYFSDPAIVSSFPIRDGQVFLKDLSEDTMLSSLSPYLKENIV